MSIDSLRHANPAAKILSIQNQQSREQIKKHAKKKMRREEILRPLFLTTHETYTNPRREDDRHASNPLPKTDSARRQQLDQSLSLSRSSRLY